MSSTRKTMYYAEVVCQDGQELAKLLAVARQKSKAIEARTEEIGGRTRFVTQWRSMANGARIGGVVVEYTEGDVPPGIVLDKKLEEIEVSTFATPGKLNQKFISGSAYFVTTKEHLVYFCTGHFRESQLAAHLDWLVRVQLKLLPPPNTPVWLERRARKAQSADINDLRSIRIRGDVVRNAGHGAEARVSRRFTNALSYILPNDKGGAFKERLAVPDAKALDTLEVVLEIRVIGRRKHDETAIIDWLAHNVDPDLIERVDAVRAGGDRISGSELVLKDTREVPAKHGIPLFIPALNVLNEYLDELSDLNHI